MKMTFKIKVLTSISLFLVVFIMPMSAGAQRAATPTPNNICNRINGASSAADVRLLQKQADLETKRIERLKKIETNQNERDAKQEKNRTEADKRRSSQIGKLETKTSNAEHKQAITKFKSTLDSAVKMRRAAVDSAIETFRNGLDSAIKTRHAAIKTALTNLKSTMDTTIAQAKADCATGADPSVIETNLEKDLKAAKDKFQGSKAEIEKINTQLQELKATRNQALKKAAQDFKTTIEKAAQELKAALK